MKLLPGCLGSMTMADVDVEAARALVHEVARRAGAPGRHSERAQRVADAVRAGGGYRWVGVYSVDDATVTVDAWSGPAMPAHPAFPRERGLTGAAIAACVVVVSNDVASDPRYLTTMDSTGSELIAPVAVAGRVVGTIDIESDRTDAFAHSDAQLALRLAAAAAPLWDAG
jgi:putative methionine-R-sulfoxide reductase with GAF domain